MKQDRIDLEPAFRMAQNFARFIRRKYRLTEEDQADLEQEFKIAAIAAVHDWNPRLGSIETYAGWKMKGRLRIALREITGGQITKYNRLTPLEFLDEELPYYAQMAGVISREMLPHVIAIRVAIQQLPWRQREVADLIMVGLDSGEIARELGITTQALHIRKKKLRDILNKSLNGGES
jgi:RNA polymerase sigma factor (sigma-70 family)